MCVLALVLSVSALPNFKAEFEAFEEKYNKNYANGIERLQRFVIFQKNLRDIENFNQRKNASWKKGINQFSDMTEEEFQKT